MYENFFFKQQMAPYAPSAETTDRWAQEDQAKQAAADQQAKANRIAEIKSRIAEIDSLIAEKHGPYAAAAEAARLGDFTPYLQLLSQQATSANQAAMSAKGIDNMLFDAEKLTWGLKSKNAEDREMVRSNIAATLRRAEDAARKQGVDLSKNESYQRLKAAMDEGARASIVYEGEEKFANTLWSKSQAGNLRDEDIVKAKEWVEAHPDSQFASKVIQVVQEYAPKTTESKARASKRKADARDLFTTLSDLPKDEQARRMRNLTATERKLLEDYYPEFLK